MLHHAADEYHLNDLVITYHEAPYCFYVYYYFIKLPVDVCASFCLLLTHLLAGSSVIMEAEEDGFFLAKH